MSLTGQLKVSQTKRGIANLRERIQPPCGCGRKTYRLNANHSEMCAGCDEDSVLCTCKPTQKFGTVQLTG